MEAAVAQAKHPVLLVGGARMIGGQRPLALHRQHERSLAPHTRACMPPRCVPTLRCAAARRQRRTSAWLGDADEGARGGEGYEVRRDEMEVHSVRVPDLHSGHSLSGLVLVYP